MTLQTIQNNTAPIFQKAKVSKAAVFGSYARGDAKAESDVDIIVKFKDESNLDLDQLLNLKSELEQAVGKKVDLSRYTKLHKLYRPFVFRDQKVIYRDED